MRGLPSGPFAYFICTSDSTYRGFFAVAVADVEVAAQAGSAAVIKLDALAVKVTARRNWALELCDDMEEPANPLIPLNDETKHIACRESFMI